MEVPFYYSFKEFKENYENDLKKWLEVYTEGDEKYYLDEIDKIYKYSINSEYIEVKYYGDPYPECKEIDLNVYFKIIQNRLEAYIEVMKLNPTNEYEYESFITHEIFNNQGKFQLYEDDYPISIYEDWYILDYYSFYHRYSPFLKASTTLFDEFRLDFDSVKFINFQFAKGKIINFINERRKLLNEKSQSTPPDEVEPITLPENTDKIQINGNYQLLAFLFRELIDKGYITAPTYLGKPSHKRTAEMLLKHFEFTNKTEQPSVDNLTNYIKNNTYSMQKQSLFKIPSVKNAND